jgi:hypothetical protein
VIRIYQRAIAVVGRFLPRLASALNVPERWHRRRLVQHRGHRRRIPASVIVPDKRPTGEDVAIAARLLAAHRAAAADAPGPAGERLDEWTINYEQQGQMATLLGRGDPAELAAYMCNAARHDATHGFLQGQYEYERLMRDAAYRRWVVLMTRDKLHALAEAVGAAPIENPEQWPPASRTPIDSALLVEAIERQLGLSIAPPDVDGGLLKLATARGLFSDRDLWGIYTASLLRDALADRQAACVCEIGGGAGRVAYWSYRMGLRAYTVIDLPHANAVQGYHLLKVLPADAVVLYGEQGWEDALDRVRVLPTHAAATAAGHGYDLVLNQDSFPEMHPSTVEDYLRWIGRVCPGGLMLSINHENKARYGRLLRPRERDLAHVCVPEVVERMGGFRRLQRAPYWLRRGYAAELYRVGGGLEDLHVGAVADDEAVGLRQGGAAADAYVAADQARLDAVLEVPDRGA